MTFRRFAWLGPFLLLFIAVLGPGAPLAPPTPAKAAAGSRRPVFINGVLDTGQFLPDTAEIGRVNEVRITSRDFIETYYNAYAPDRPAQDSLGRVEWLNSMVNKVVLGTLARHINRTLDFEDRASLREVRQRTLSNVLFLRGVLDSVRVDTAEVRAVYEREFRTDYHLKHILFGDWGSAESTREDLAAGKITWNQAVAHTTAKSDVGPDGDLGWVRRMNVGAAVAQELRALRPGEVSQPVEDAEGYHLVMVLARRPADPPSFESASRVIEKELRDRDTEARAERLMGALRTEMHVRYDSTALRWASHKFRPLLTTEKTAKGMGVVLDPSMPEFSPADTSRVLASYDGGALTLRRVLDEYSAAPPFKRPTLSTLNALRMEVDNILLEPARAAMAERLGLDKDPFAVAAVEKKREEILVTHLYKDSVESRIRVSAAERRRYYDRHRSGFMTYATARYAELAADDSAQAEALIKRLKNGEKAEDMVHQDSIAGRADDGQIGEDRENSPSNYHSILFERMKPGDAHIVSITDTKKLKVLKLLSFDPGHLLPWKEAEPIADDAVRAEKSEALFKALIARHRRAFKIQLRPELVMRIRLLDPASGV